MEAPTSTELGRAWAVCVPLRVDFGAFAGYGTVRPSPRGAVAGGCPYPPGDLGTGRNDEWVVAAARQGPGQHRQEAHGQTDHQGQVCFSCDVQQGDSHTRTTPVTQPAGGMGKTTPERPMSKRAAISSGPGPRSGKPKRARASSAMSAGWPTRSRMPSKSASVSPATPARA